MNVPVSECRDDEALFLRAGAGKLWRLAEKRIQPKRDPKVKTWANQTTIAVHDQCASSFTRTGATVASSSFSPAAPRRNVIFESRLLRDDWADRNHLESTLLVLDHSQMGGLKRAIADDLRLRRYVVLGTHPRTGSPDQSVPATPGSDRQLPWPSPFWRPTGRNGGSAPWPRCCWPA